MDFSNDKPERLWVLRPEKHEGTLPEWCYECDADLDLESGISIPVYNDKPLCRHCAIKRVRSKSPVTVEYMTWLEQGDMRWWSPWFCNCKGCTGETTKAE